MALIDYALDRGDLKDSENASVTLFLSQRGFVSLMLSAFDAGSNIA